MSSITTHSYLFVVVKYYVRVAFATIVAAQRFPGALSSLFSSICLSSDARHSTNNGFLAALVYRHLFRGFFYLSAC